MCPIWSKEVAIFQDVYFHIRSRRKGFLKVAIHLVKGRVVAKVVARGVAKAKARNLVKAPNPRVVARVVARVVSKAKARNLVKAPNPRVERDLEREIFRATTQSVIVS